MTPTTEPLPPHGTPEYWLWQADRNIDRACETGDGNHMWQAIMQIRTALRTHLRGDAPPPTPARPTVVCLCGSTRFYDAFQRANFAETMAGRIVLSVGFYPHSAEQAHGEAVGITPEQKEALDILHLRKLDLCDEVLILNCEDYVGTSTHRELVYARHLGKRIRWLNPTKWGLSGEVVG